MNSSQGFAFGIAHGLRPALPGLLFAILTLLFGFGLGIVFGLDEEAIKSRLSASAVEVRDAIYHGDDAAMQPVLDKSWVYMQRAHLHAGGLGTTALGLTLLVALLGASGGITRIISLGLGAGGLGYSVLALGGISRACAWGHVSSQGIAQVARHAVIRGGAACYRCGCRARCICDLPKAAIRSELSGWKSQDAANSVSSDA